MSVPFAPTQSAAPKPRLEASPNLPRRVGGLKSLGSIVGCDPDGAPRRPVIDAYHMPPPMLWAARNKWLRQVRGLLADCRTRHESGVPFFVEPVARAIAELGDVCKASIDFISRKAACCETAAKKATAWLESKGALTWSNTCRKDKSGRIVRSVNIYKLIANFGGITAIIARTMRAIWRERPRVVSVSKGAEHPGLPSYPTYIDPYEARMALERHSKVFEAQMLERLKAERLEKARKWQARYAVSTG